MHQYCKSCENLSIFFEFASNYKPTTAYKTGCHIELLRAVVAFHVKPIFEGADVFA